MSEKRELFIETMKERDDFLCSAAKIQAVLKAFSISISFLANDDCDPAFADILSKIAQGALSASVSVQVKIDDMSDIRSILEGKKT